MVASLKVICRLFIKILRLVKKQEFNFHSSYNSGKILKYYSSPSDSTVRIRKNLLLNNQAEVTVKHESSSIMWINMLSLLHCRLLFSSSSFSMMGNMGEIVAEIRQVWTVAGAKAANKEDIKVRFSDVAVPKARISKLLNF